MDLEIFLEKLEKDLLLEINQSSKPLLEGLFSEFHQMKYAAGRLKGLQDALNIVNKAKSNISAYIEADLYVKELNRGK